MENVIYFLAAGIVIVVMILKFDKQQRAKANKLLKETKSVQPLFLLRAVEQKLRNLNTILYGNMPNAVNELPTGRVNMNEGARQLIASQLSKVVSDYNSEQISLKTYNNQLSDLLKMVDEIKGMSFEQIK